MLRICLMILLTTCLGCTADRSFLPGQGHLFRIDAPDVPPVTARTGPLVVSYNIQYGEDVQVALDDLRRAGLDQADLLLLQEMTPAGVDTLAAALGLHARYQPASIHPHHGRPFGNAVLSRWPIVADQLAVLPHAHPFTGQQRTALACDVDMGGTIVRVVSLHLATMVLSPQARLNQARAALDQLVDAWEGPLIIAGDFNTAMPSDMQDLRRLYRRQTRLRPVNLGQDCTVRWNVGQPLGLGCQLDHIFQRGLPPGAAGVATGARASDHFPVWARLGWPSDG